MELLDYIKWRGDLTFDERELNEIDSVLFSTLCYETFDEILKESVSLTISEVSKLFFSMYEEEKLKNRINFSNRAYEVLKAMANTTRYGSLVLSNYVNEIDHDIDLQFSALTIEYKNKWKYIAFRGTDDTFTGWKEDFSLFYKDEVLSQKKAIKYLNKVTQDKNGLFSKMNYYVGGHSKGGNLAIYASAKAPLKVQKRIKRIDNFDGPGFKEEVWDSPSMQNIISKIHTYLPTSSFFGRLFTHQGNVKIIKSKLVGLLQHSTFQWCVNVDRFIYETDLSKKSNENIDDLNKLLNELDEDERVELVESLFSVLDTIGVHTFTDLTKINANMAIKGLVEVVELSNHTKKNLMEVIKIFINASLA